MAGISSLKAPVAIALKLALVTGQRIGEVCGMTESELDMPKACGQFRRSGQRTEKSTRFLYPILRYK